MDYYCAGIHPWDVAKLESLSQKLFNLRKVIQGKKCVALGEVGIDRNYPDLEKQKKLMIEQLELAVEFDLPVVIHSVKAINDVLFILKKFPENLKVYLHGINLNEQELNEVNKRKYFIGLGPQFFNRSKIQKIIHSIPKDKILIETDDTGLSINQIFETLSLRLGRDSENLKFQLNSNFLNFFLLIIRKVGLNLPSFKGKY